MYISEFGGSVWLVGLIRVLLLENRWWLNCKIFVGVSQAKILSLWLINVMHNLVGTFLTK